MASKISISCRAAIAALALSCTAAAGAQDRPMPPPSGPLTFDVAGVRLGMSPEAAKAALIRAGYRIDSTGTVSSFDQTVKAEAARRRGKSVVGDFAGTSLVLATGPHQEHAEVHLLQRPGGSSVAGITVDIPTTAIASDAFWQQAFAKYPKGGTVRSQGTEVFWCSVEVGANCGLGFVVSGPMSAEYPLLTATSGSVGGGRLWLQIGQRAYDAQRAEVEAAVVRLVPKTSSAAF